MGEVYFGVAIKTADSPCCARLFLVGAFTPLRRTRVLVGVFGALPTLATGPGWHRAWEMGVLGTVVAVAVFVFAPPPPLTGVVARGVVCCVARAERPRGLLYSYSRDVCEVGKDSWERTCEARRPRVVSAEEEEAEDVEV